MIYRMSDLRFFTALTTGIFSSLLLIVSADGIRSFTTLSEAKKEACLGGQGSLQLSSGTHPMPFLYL